MASFQRIAADLRARIESGQLGPGARVPSTRALAKKWKVATATAAHALRALTDAGLIRAVPRSGTLVAGADTHATLSRDGELSRARVIAAAIEIADEEGLAALSLRSLAARLKAPTMSLYRHVRSKDALLTLMADAALGEERSKLTAPPTLTGWRARLELGARLEWRVLKAHPWLARVVHISRPSPMPSSIMMANWVMGALEDTPLSASRKLEVHVLLHSFIQGIAVNLEAEATALGETGISDEEHMRENDAQFRALAATGEYPYFARMMGEISKEFTLDFDRLFESGLTVMLDGLALKLERRGTGTLVGRMRQVASGRLSPK